MKAKRSKTWRQIAKEELAGRRPGFHSFDDVIARYDGLKRAAEAAAREQENYRRKVLIPLAKKEGFRKGSALLLAGFRNSALIERVLDVFITDQAAAAKLPADIRRLYVVTTFKPNEVLKKSVRFGISKGFPVLERFIAKAVKTRRHWRVSRLNVRPAVPARRTRVGAGLQTARRKKAA